MEPSKNFKEICSNFRSDYVGNVESAIVDTINTRDNMSNYPSGMYQSPYNTNHTREEIVQKIGEIVKDDNYLTGFEEKKESFKQFMTTFNKYVIKEPIGSKPFEVFSDGIDNLDESIYYHMYLAVFCMNYFYGDDAPDPKVYHYMSNLIRRIYRWPTSANLLAVLCTKIQKLQIQFYSSNQQLVPLKEIVLEPPKESYI